MQYEVVQVRPTDDFKVYVYFSNGAVRLFDVAPLIQKGGVFEKISEKDFFKQSCVVMNRTLAWDIGGNFDEYQCLDIDPESIFTEGKSVKDPLCA